MSKHPFTVVTYCLCGCHDHAGLYWEEEATAAEAVASVRRKAEGRNVYVVAVFEGHRESIGSEDDYPEEPDEDGTDSTVLSCISCPTKERIPMTIYENDPSSEMWFMVSRHTDPEGERFKCGVCASPEEQERAKMLETEGGDADA